MSEQIIRQPDGRLAVWSSVVDNFIHKDIESAEDLIDEWVSDARKQITEKVNDVIAALERGEHPYHHFTMTFDDCTSAIELNAEKPQS